MYRHSLRQWRLHDLNVQQPACKADRLPIVLSPHIALFGLPHFVYVSCWQKTCFRGNMDILHLYNVSRTL